jgi:radical SAM superfamily enzyme YgiQ (UPF0313 family)
MNLLAVEKPARYMGGEMGSIRKDEADLRFALAFPDVYEVGMSHLGLRILYHILNEAAGIAAERVFAPWPDMEKQLHDGGLPLTTLESATPLNECDIIGFTLQYELSYTNIVNMLRLGDIPFLSAERPNPFPLIVAGGPCAYNPEPLAPFFDAVLLGDGEEAVLEIAQAALTSKRPEKAITAAGAPGSHCRGLCPAFLTGIIRYYSVFIQIGTLVSAPVLSGSTQHLLTGSRNCQLSGRLSGPLQAWLLGRPG